MKLFKSIESAPADSPVVDLEQALLDLEIADIELTELFDEGAKIAHSYEMYALIVDTIEKSGGVTKSLEAMFGENFSSVDAMQSEASAEAFEWAEKAWNWIVTFFKKMVAWISSLWASTDKVRADLRALKAKAATIKFPFKVAYKKIGEIEAVANNINAFAQAAGAIKGGAVASNFADLNAKCGSILDAMAKAPAVAEELEIKSASDLTSYIDKLEGLFKSMFGIRATFEELTKAVASDKYKAPEKKEGEQPKEGEAAPADNNKVAELQSKFMEIGKFVQKSNRALVVASKMLLASAAENK